MLNSVAARSLGRASLVVFSVSAVLGVTGTATAAKLTTPARPTVKSWSPHTAAKGAKVTFKGTDLGGVTGVTWVIYPGPKSYSARFTKSATAIVAISPVAFPAPKTAGVVEFKGKSGTTIAACWGAC
jgi:hypothetical protein